MDFLVRLNAKRERLFQRARILRSVRTFFLNRGFLEVNTPLLSQSVLPEEHIDVVESDEGYLLPSPEIHMKCLLAAGYEKIFQIGPCFRKGERGKHHLPEFTMLEWYRVGVDYSALAEDCEQLLSYITEQLLGTDTISFQGFSVDLALPWPRVKVGEAFQRYAGWDPTKEEDSERFERDFAEKVIPGMNPRRPQFMMDFPHYEASLARRKADDSLVAERLELFAGGLELANGFTELVDAEEQRSRFELANEKRRERGGCPYAIPEGFLATLGHLLPCAGIALGLDRLVMLLTDASTIDQVVAVGPSDL